MSKPELDLGDHNLVFQRCGARTYEAGRMVEDRVRPQLTKLFDQVDAIQKKTREDPPDVLFADEDLEYITDTLATHLEQVDGKPATEVLGDDLVQALDTTCLPYELVNLYLLFRLACGLSEVAAKKSNGSSSAPAIQRPTSGTTARPARTSRKK